MKIEMKDLNGPQTHELLTSAISPLPIALISTVGEDGIYNAAPYSLTIPVSWNPPIVCVSFGLRGAQKKDTQLRALGRVGNGIYCRAKDIFKLTAA